MYSKFSKYSKSLKLCVDSKVFLKIAQLVQTRDIIFWILIMIIILN